MSNSLHCDKSRAQQRAAPLCTLNSYSYSITTQRPRPRQPLSTDAVTPHTHILHPPAVPHPLRQPARPLVRHLVVTKAKALEGGASREGLRQTRHTRVSEGVVTKVKGVEGGASREGEGEEEDEVVSQVLTIEN